MLWIYIVPNALDNIGGRPLLELGLYISWEFKKNYSIFEILLALIFMALMKALQ